MKLTAVLFGFATLAAIPAHAEWTQRVQLPTPERLRTGVWDGSKFIVVGGFGAVRVSADGVHWTSQTISGNPNLISVATNGLGVSVALDDEAFAWTTTDGASWTKSPSALGNQLGSIQWTGNRFVAGAGYNTGSRSYSSLASTDGRTWSPDSALGIGQHPQFVGNAGLELMVDYSVSWRQPGLEWRTCSTGTTKSMHAAARGQGLWVIAGDSGKVLTSPDTKSWTSTTIGSGDVSILRLAFLGGLWVAVGGSHDTCIVYTSPDASVWTRRYRFTGSSGGISQPDIAHDATRWTVLENGRKGRVATSNDGIQWTAQILPGDRPMDLAGGEQSDETVLSNGTGTLVVRGNGILAWREGSSPWTATDVVPRSLLQSVAYHDGIWLAAGVQGDSAILWRSTDGLSWSPARFKFKGAYQAYLGALFAARGLFILSAAEPGHVGETSVSEDGITWTYVSDCTIDKVADNGHVLVSANNASFDVCSSEDGRTWTHRKTKASLEGFWDVHWSKDRFVAFGSFSTLWSSADGVDWTVADFKSDLPGDIMQLGWNGTIWCLRGTSGTYISADADQWVRATSGVDNYTVGTTWKGSFVSEDKNFGRAEAISSSSDGKVWVSDTISKDSPVGLAGFHDLGDTLYAMAANRYFERTSDLKTWETEYFTSNAITAMAHADGLLVAVGENSNIWTRPTNAVDVGIRPRAVRNATQFLLTGRTLRIPGGASLSADLVDLRGRVVARATPRGEDLVMDLRGAGSGMAALRVRDAGRIETRMLVLP